MSFANVKQCMKEKVRVSDLKYFERASNDLLKTYDNLGFVESIVKHKDGDISVYCEMGFLRINKEGYEEILVTDEDNPFIKG